MNKLQKYGIQDKLLLWLSDYISDREQRVFVNGEYSTAQKLKAGVPQGSMLGPLPFLVNITDVADTCDTVVRLCAYSIRTPSADKHSK